MAPPKCALAKDVSYHRSQRNASNCEHMFENSSCDCTPTIPALRDDARKLDGRESEFVLAHRLEEPRAKVAANADVPWSTIIAMRI